MGYGTGAFFGKVVSHFPMCVYVCNVRDTLGIYLNAKYSTSSLDSPVDIHSDHMVSESCYSVYSAGWLLAKLEYIWQPYNTMTVLQNPPHYNDIVILAGSHYTHTQKQRLVELKDSNVTIM